MSTENIGSMPMNSKRRNVHSNKPEALAVQEVSADSAVRVRVSPTVTEPIGIVPMEKDFPVATLVDFRFLRINVRTSGRKRTRFCGIPRTGL